MLFLANLLIVLILCVGCPLLLYHLVLKKRDLVSRFVWIVVIIPIVSILAGIVGMNLCGVLHALIETLGAPIDRLENDAVTRLLIRIPGLDCEFGLVSWFLFLSGLVFLYCFADTVIALIRKHAQ